MVVSRTAAFRFTLQPSAEQERLLRVAGGASRLAYNTLLGMVKEALETRQADPSAAVPWSRFDLINLINSWKRSELVANGLDWHLEIPSLVFEEAAVDLSRGLAAFSASRSGERAGPKVGFPRFKAKNSTPYSFRVRNQRGSVGVGAGGLARTIRMPKIGSIKVRENTRRLRRMLRCGLDLSGRDVAPRATITAVTVRRHRGRWIASVAVRAADFHPALRHTPRVGDNGGGENDRAGAGGWVGLDRGLTDLIVAGDDAGQEITRIEAPKIFRRRLEGQRRRARAVSRKKPRSRGRCKAAAKLAAYHARTVAIREHFLHQVTTRLVKNHDRLVIENLYVLGMLANHHLAKSLSDAGFGILGRMLVYKANWYGCHLVEVDRWFPSSKICSGCGVRKKKLPLSERVFLCTACGLEIDRDLNAAINLARQGAVLERLGRDPSRDSGPASSGPGNQRPPGGRERHRHTDAATTGPKTTGTHRAA
ncbi:MAG: RNA-guided endonuclease InsQ/TnpB family protein [Actinomadura sp.]